MSPPRAAGRVPPSVSAGGDDSTLLLCIQIIPLYSHQTHAAPHLPCLYPTSHLHTPNANIPPTGQYITTYHSRAQHNTYIVAVLPPLPLCLIRRPTVEAGAGSGGGMKPTRCRLSCDQMVHPARCRLSRGHNGCWQYSGRARTHRRTRASCCPRRD